MGVSEILIGQGDLSQQISRLLTNYKKSKTRVTKSYIETRLELLESNFLTFKTNHSKILEVTSSEEKKNLQYFKEDFYYNCEDEYLELKTLMKEHLEELAPRTVTPTKCCEHENMVTAPLAKYALKTKLPAIEIPSFSGNYNEWTSFYDLYKSLIHDNPELSNIQKYHYLKSNLKGDAELLLRQFPLTDANYSKALEVLEARYNNKRLIVHSHITRLIGQKKLSLESAKGIRSLLDTTNESLNALDNVGVSTANWDPLVTHIIVAKFDSESHRLWEQRLGGTRDLPSTKDLLEFMEMRFRTLESLQITNPREVASRTPQLKTFKASTEPVCTLCSEDHYIHSCKEFTKLSPEERRDIAREKQLCFNCLIPRHSVRFCRQNTSCKICKRRHHSLLHLNTTEPQQVHSAHIDEDEEEVRDDEETTQLAVHTADITGTQVLLATAMVRIRGKDGKRHALRALIDQGSQASFITTSAAQRLGLHREHVYSRVTGIDTNFSTMSKEIVGFNLYNLRDDKPVVEVKAHVLRTLSSILPRKEANVTCAAEIKKLTLADPTFYQPSGIDLLLGAEVYAQILMEGVKRFGSVLAQNSLLGWLISGKVDGSHTEMNEVVVMHSQLQTDDILQRFWESEELQTKTRIQTASEAQCEKIFEETHSRTESGRYIVALPFSTDNETPLGESRSLAVKRLLNMVRRFQRDEVFQQRYKGFMDEYEDLQHMEKVSITDLRKPDVCYLPHHGVLREESTTTKLRVVFDGSAETSTGISLNEKLLIGPTLQHDIRDIFLRWRMHKVCLVADIQRMYRQILVRAEDQDYQRIVWRKSTADPISEYRLCTVTYGTSCAPYLAIKVLQQLACDERNAYPIAASVLERDFYVDDLLSGCDSEIEAIQLCKDLIFLLERGGFILHKWGSNSVDVLNSLPKDDSQPQGTFDIKMEKSVKTLGVKWNPRDDCFELNMNFSHDAHNKLTKRVVLSDIAKIYDPLGWLSPAVIVAKIFLQRLWLLGVGWDDELPVDVQSEWALFKDQVNNVEVVTLPRWIGTTAANLKVEIHGFSDASNVAYAGVVYIRIIDTSGVTVKILAAKTKVAPIKQLSIPRLELCGAVLTAKLMERIKICLNISDENVYGWTDSTIVLAWLQKHPNSWKTFVGNRVAEILNVTRPTQWHHVNSNDNPADCASRGMSPIQLPQHELWWNGPSWLNSTNKIVANNELHETDLEFKLSTHTVNIDELPNEFIIQNYSSLMRLKRVIAYCLRFVGICKYKIQAKQVGHAINISEVFPAYLTSNELKRAMNCCVKMSQNCYFSEEIDMLSHWQGVSKKSPLYFLHPFIDENELLRVGGRLKNAPIPRDTKHPFILSGKSQLAKLIIDQVHKRTLHGGPLLMMNVIRANYWITNVKSLVKLHVRKCIACIRYSPRFATQLMGNLPAARVTISKPFSSSGVDFAGPCYLKSSKLRNAASIKAYIAIFICTVTKAIHLELVSELSTNAFIAAFKRFSSRRGHCAHLYSDCGTNFIGANFELAKMLNKSKASLPTELKELLASDGTEWHFISPGSPHFGGLWERDVRSIKHHIRRVIGDSKLTFEEYSTLLSQIECCLNSRPISALSDSVDDYTALTPGHFLMLGPPIVVPHEDVIDVPINRLNRWQHIEHMLQSFWKRWTQEYLVTLQNRYKWTTPQHSLKINDLVIIKKPSSV